MDSKACAVCGRTITWRKKWAADWDSIRYCSSACRKRRGLSDIDRALEAAILALLMNRRGVKSICPSEAARSVSEDWRPLMEPARQAARRLVANGLIEITQGGHVVDPSTAKGPIRLRSTTKAQRSR